VDSALKIFFFFFFGFKRFIKLIIYFYTLNSFWLMHFDTNPVVIAELRKLFNNDPRVIRGNIIKLGERLEDIIERPDKTH
jgi:ribosomal protein S6